MGEALLNKLRADVRYDTVDKLEPLSNEERTQPLISELLRGAKVHNEEGVKYVYGLLQLSLQDIVGRDDEDGLRRLAASASEIFPQLPEYKEVKEEQYGFAGDREIVKKKKPTLVELKKELLKSIANRWARTKDEDEATRLGHLLVQAAKSSFHAVLVTEALHVATERVHHKERALRLMGRMALETTENEPTRKLLTGVMRTLGRHEIEKLVPLLVQLPFDDLNGRYGALPPDALLDAITDMAEGYRLMHLAMEGLRGTLQAGNRLGSEVKIFAPTYRPQGRMKLDIGVTSWSDHDKENKFHEMAQKVHDQIKEWLEARKAAKNDDVDFISLRVFWPVQRGEPKLVRTFDIR